MKKSISVITAIVAALLVVGAISGTTFAAGHSPTQVCSDADAIAAPLGDYGDRSAPPVDGLIASTADTPTGSSYMLIDNWGGNWADAEKLPPDDGVGNPGPPFDPNEEDDLMCWAAAASNILEWSGWGFVSTFDNTDDMFQEFQDHWVDDGGVANAGWNWWFDGTDPGGGAIDVTGGGNFWPSYTFSNYYHQYDAGTDDPDMSLQKIDDWLHAGYGVTLSIKDGGHAITVWGYNYDSGVDKSTNPNGHYLGIWITDSDDDKDLLNPPDVLQYYEVEYDATINRWRMPNYGGGWFIRTVRVLEPFPDDTRPVANAGTAYVGPEGSAIIFDGSASSDADGDTLQYRWDFNNDRVWDTGWSGPTASFTWNDDYTGTVVLEVFDGRLRDVDTATVTVNNVAPVITVVGDTIDENGTATVSGTITDPSSLDTFTVVIDWGEGSPQSYSYPAGSTSYSETHQYLDDNPTGTPSDVYPISVTVTDDDGGSDTESGIVVVNNVDPVVTSITMTQPNPEFILPVVHELGFKGTFTDVGTKDTHTALWDWGDGSSSTGIVSESGGSGIVTGGPHTYSDPGDYTVTLTVTDDDTGYHSNTYLVHVADVAEALDITNGYIQSLPGTAFRGKANLRKAAINNMFKAIDDMLADEEYNGMISDLRSNIRGKADGYVDGKLSNDWIIDKVAQQEICQKIDDITAYLATLL